MLDRDVAPGIHRVEEAYTNLYLVEDEGGVTVVDAGVPTAWKPMLAALGAVGRTPDHVRALVLTHGHFDHLGFAERARSELGVPVYVHEDDVPLTRHPLQYAHERARTPYFLTQVRAFPIVAALLRSRAFWPAPVGEVARYTGGTLPVPGSPAVVPTPGHTLGHTALYFPDRDATIAGDAVVMLDPYTAKRAPKIVAGAATADSVRALRTLDALAERAPRRCSPGTASPGAAARPPRLRRRAGRGLPDRRHGRPQAGARRADSITAMSDLERHGANGGAPETERPAAQTASASTTDSGATTGSTASSGTAPPARAPARPNPRTSRRPPGDAPIGGQAVLEGVMMRGVSTWAVAVRTPSPEQREEGREIGPEEAALGEIEIQSEPLVSWTRRHRALRLPVIRGVVALVESLKIGYRALAISANAQLEEEGKEIGGKTWVGTIALSLVLGIGLFFLLPAGITNLFGDALPNSLVFVVIEKLIRISIFLAYIWLISRMRDLQRVFQYHGAEHKTIACYEAGLPLTPENAGRFSRLHPRCGTSFLLIVMIVAIVVFAPLGRPDWPILLASRVIGIPLVAGLSFEVLKLFGRKRDKAWARALMWPGLQLQRLTTREPDHDQLEVGIAALEAVLAVEDPAEASEEDKVGMEVVA